MTGKKGPGDSYEMVLESRHLLAVFFAVVLLCALFFTFGFVLGRSQGQERTVTQANGDKSATSKTDAGAPQPEDLSFYDRVEKSAEPPPPSPKATAPAPAPTPPDTKPAAGATQPIYLQVAALSQETDANRLSQRLQQLGFPAVIRPPQADKLYRVQVGPFATGELADAAERRLQAQGFRQIVRR